jgi:UDP-glucose 4-epimerase
MSPKKIAITGVSGYFGRALMPLLEADPEIERVIGIDQQPPPEEWEKLRFHKLDIRDPELAHVLSGADCLVHLAFVLMRKPGDDETDDINIHGTQHVIKTCAQVQIPKLILTSSVVGYGLHPDNPVPLTEESPLRPNPHLYYSRAKAANEAFLDTFEAEHPQMCITRLRPCTVVGPNADPAQMEQLVASVVPLVGRFDPPYQLLHEEDMASALHLFIREDHPGVYNITSDESRSLSQLVRSRGGKVVRLPRPIVRALLAVLWRLRASVFAPEWVDLSCFSIVASNDKAKEAGWSPAYTTPQAYLAVLEAFGPDQRSRTEVRGQIGT